MPSSSAITWSGSSAAISVTKSHSPRAATVSTSSSQTRRTGSVSRPIWRGVKPLLTSARSLECRGGSMFSIISRWVASTSSGGSPSSAPRRSEEYVAQSRETATMSWYRVTAQNGDAPVCSWR